MTLFFLFIFGVYGSVHVYAFLRARNVLAFGPVAGVVLALFMLVMICGLFLVRSLEQHEYELTARMLAYVTYFWMAGLFLFFSVSLLFDVLALMTRLGGWISRSDITAFRIPARTSFFVSVGLALAVSVYGYFEAQDIRMERVRVETAKLPAGTDRLTIAQISDVHLGLIIRCDRLEKMLEVVKEAKPDIFISTGDLVDAQINHLTGLADLLRSVKTTYGNYAITGNHEYYAGLDRALEFTRVAGFRMLHNEVVSAGPVNLVGVDDRTAVQMKLQRPPREKDLLAQAPRDRFTLFLKHQPRVDPATVGLFDLQISGHTHKGQIFPFYLLTRLTFPMNAGSFDLGRGSLLHVSRGTGTWGPPIRFLAPPEVTIIELVRTAS